MTELSPDLPPDLPLVVPESEITGGGGALPFGRTAADLKISDSAYQWSVRLFSLMRKMLGVKLNLRDAEGVAHDGEIFLFNHFSRFETFIPQYLLHQSSNVYCRAVASAEFFNDNDAVSSYLARVGAVPNDFPGLLPYLAAEILRGRKVVVFPEGGIVKDRRVLDHDGQYRVYSRTAQDRRKHHSGAAVLGLALEAFRAQVCRAYDAGENELVQRWAQRLTLTPDELLVAARRKTSIVPANITFFPIRVDANLLSKGAELLGKGFSPRVMEELLVEGNILFEDTDMDIQLGEPIYPRDRWRPWERRLITRLAQTGQIDGLETLFTFVDQPKLIPRILHARMTRKVDKLRNGYMHGMYRAVTINLSHLAASVLRTSSEAGDSRISVRVLHRVLYLAVKELQEIAGLHLHESLLDPDVYSGLLENECASLAQFLDAMVSMKLLDARAGDLVLSPRLLLEHGFDEIRLQNLAAVYANEVAPIAEVGTALTAARNREPTWAGDDVGLALFDDARRRFELARARYDAPPYAQINAAETATEDSSPYLLTPANAQREVGILLVHGFLASPAELRGLGNVLAERGYAVYGMRLKGHGTSPWDLREQAFEDWLESVRRGYRLIEMMCERVCVIGFSTGAALALRLASESPVALAGVISVCAPMRFKKRAMAFVPVVHGANQLVRLMSTSEGIMPFRENESENPSINYQHMPIRGLYELQRMVDDLKPRLGDVAVPALVVQADGDPVVAPESAQDLVDRLPRASTKIQLIAADHHGIVFRDTGQTRSLIVDFAESLKARV
jgi:esterase/lipase/1-acyl-sn-glycerol-3-phosphate acyltransferase